MKRNLVFLLAVVMLVFTIAGAQAGPGFAYPAQAAGSDAANLAACTPFVLDGAQAGVEYTTATGSAEVTLNPQTRQLSWHITFSGLTSAVTGAHFHGPAMPGQDAGVKVPITGSSSPMHGSATLTESQMLQVLNGQWYVNIHTSTYPAGEIRGQVALCADPEGPALPVTFPLDGSQSGTGSAVTGSGVVWVDAAAKMVYYNIRFGDFPSALTAAHFHGPALPGQDAPVVLPFTGTTSPIEGAAELSDQQMLQVLNGQWYANLHTVDFPAGEIRGQALPNLSPASDDCLSSPWPLDGAQAGFTDVNGYGSGLALLDVRTGALTWNIAFQGLTGAPVSAHFHGPAQPGQDAGVQVPINDLTSPAEGSAVLTPAQMADVLGGRWYANIHTNAHPGGEIRGQAAVCMLNPYQAALPLVSK